MIRRATILMSVVAALATSGARAAIPEAAAPIQALDQALVTVMHDGKSTPFAQRYATLAPVVQQTFDLDTILDVYAGRATGRAR